MYNNTATLVAAHMHTHSSSSSSSTLHLRTYANGQTVTPSVKIMSSASVITRKSGSTRTDKMRSVQLQTTICASAACNSTSEVICRHCSQHYCHLCFMCHRKYLMDDMRAMSEQMATNRRQGVTEVIAFIDKQAKDAHDEAKKLVDDAIDRILKASKNIYTYIENRRQAKLGRLDECLEKFDKDAEMLDSKLARNIFLPADAMLDLRRKYAYNMFDTTPLLPPVSDECTALQRKNERFFDNYRFYNELVNLRQKWTFLQAALTTVYFPAKKDISLDKILTFLEYRHDRVLENYREHLSLNEDSKLLSLKPTDELLNGLSFLSKKNLPKEFYNFCYIEDTLGETNTDNDESEHTSNTSHLSESLPATTTAAPGNTLVLTEVTTSTTCVKKESEQEQMVLIETSLSLINNELLKNDSGQGEDDETGSDSSQSWQVEDGEDVDVDDDENQESNHYLMGSLECDKDKCLEEYDARFVQLGESVKLLEKQFEMDFRPFVANKQQQL